MRRDKTVARVLLIFSIASFVLAAPALQPQRRLVTDRADDKPTDESEQAHGVPPAPPPSVGSLDGSEQAHGVLPAPPPSVGLPDGSEKLPSDSDSLHGMLEQLWEEHLPAAISPQSPVHQDSDPVSKVGESSSKQGVEGLPPASEAQPVQDLTNWEDWAHWGSEWSDLSDGFVSSDGEIPWELRPPAQFEVGQSSSHMESGKPGVGKTLPPLEEEAPQPLEEEAPQPLEAEAPQPSEVEAPQPLEVETHQPLEVEAPQPLEAEAPQPLEAEALPSAPETHTVFNDALKQKLKVFAGVGAVTSVIVGGAFGVDKLIKDHSHGSYVSAFFHPSLTNI